MRDDLLASGTPRSVVDDAVLVLTELLSNAYRHARPLCADGSVEASWLRSSDGELTITVTDGGGPTRPRPATPSVTARGGRGLAIIGALTREWGVRERTHGRDERNGQDETYGRDTAAGSEQADRHVTVWAVLSDREGFSDGLADGLELDLASVEELR